MVCGKIDYRRFDWFDQMLLKLTFSQIAIFLITFFLKSECMNICFFSHSKSISVWLEKLFCCSIIFQSFMYFEFQRFWKKIGILWNSGDLKIVCIQRKCFCGNWSTHLEMKSIKSWDDRYNINAHKSLKLSPTLPVSCQKNSLVYNSLPF